MTIYLNLATVNLTYNRHHYMQNVKGICYRNTTGSIKKLHYAAKINKITKRLQASYKNVHHPSL